MFIPQPSQDDDEEYYVTPNFSYQEGDLPQHNGNGFCGNMSSCPCHENQELINELEQSRQYGEVTDQEADKVYRGQTLGGW